MGVSPATTPATLGVVARKDRRPQVEARGDAAAGRDLAETVLRGEWLRGHAEAPADSAALRRATPRRAPPPSSPAPTRAIDVYRATAALPHARYPSLDVTA